MRTKRDVAEAMSLFVYLLQSGRKHENWRSATSRKKINDNGLKYLRMYEKRAKVRRNSTRERMNEKLYAILIHHTFEIGIFKTGEMSLFVKTYDFYCAFSSCPSFHVPFPEIYTL